MIVSLFPPTDIPNVRHVINYELPNRIDDYLHRIGRVANWGKATSLYYPEQDSAMAGNLVRILEQANPQVPEFLNGLVPQQHGGDEEEW